MDRPERKTLATSRSLPGPEMMRGTATRASTATAAVSRWAEASIARNRPSTTAESTNACGLVRAGRPPARLSDPLRRFTADHENDGKDATCTCW